MIIMITHHDKARKEQRSRLRLIDSRCKLKFTYASTGTVQTSKRSVSRVSDARCLCAFEGGVWSSPEVVETDIVTENSAMTEME
jgi:hypothetical protein